MSEGQRGRTGKVRGSASGGVTPHSVGRCRKATEGLGRLAWGKAPQLRRRSARGEFKNSPVDCFWRGDALQERASPDRLPKVYSFGIPFFGKAAFYTYYNEKSSVSLQNRAFFGNWREKSFLKVRSLKFIFVRNRHYHHVYGKNAYQAVAAAYSECRCGESLLSTP